MRQSLSRIFCLNLELKLLGRRKSVRSKSQHPEDHHRVQPMLIDLRSITRDELQKVGNDRRHDDTRKEKEPFVREPTVKGEECQQQIREMPLVMRHQGRKKKPCQHYKHDLAPRPMKIRRAPFLNRGDSQGLPERQI